MFRLAYPMKKRTNAVKPSDSTSKTKQSIDTSKRSHDEAFDTKLADLASLDSSVAIPQTPMDRQIEPTSPPNPKRQYLEARRERKRPPLHTNPQVHGLNLMKLLDAASNGYVGLVVLS